MCIESPWGKPDLDQDGTIQDDKHVAESTNLMTGVGKRPGGLRWVVMQRTKPSRRQANGGGLTAVGRARRERVRLAAAARRPVQVTHKLRESTKSAYQWRRRWRLFHVRHMLRGTSYLLHRVDYTPQVPVHRAAGRDETAIARAGICRRHGLLPAWGPQPVLLPDPGG